MKFTIYSEYIYTYIYICIYMYIYIYIERAIDQVGLQGRMLLMGQGTEP